MIISPEEQNEKSKQKADMRDLKATIDSCKRFRYVNTCRLYKWGTSDQTLMSEKSCQDTWFTCKTN